MEDQERDADEKRHQHARRLKFFANYQNPSCESELAAHLHRLPKECKRLVVGPQERGGLAQRRGGAAHDRVTSFPEEHSIHHWDAKGPNDNQEEGNQSSRLVLVGVTAQSEIIVEIPPCHAWICFDLEWITQKCFEYVRCCAGHE
eukprot:1109372-Prymnesium_polylepis.1